MTVAAVRGYSTPGHVRRRPPQLSDWGIGVTLCIASIADQGKAICLLSDTRVSFGFTSGEFFNKANKINQRWGVMLAGMNAASATPIIEATKAVTGGVAAPSRSLIERAFVAAVHAEQIKRVEASVLSPYNLTIDEFVKTGLKDFGPEAFADLRQQIEHVDIGCEFLVFGFDEQQKPHIFHVGARGLVEDQTRTGFWAIGSGEYAAISALSFHDYSFRLGIAEATYYVCMAKFMAERADLGQQTEMGYMNPDGSVFKIDAAVVRAIWEAEGKPQIPTNLVDRMPPLRPLLGSERSEPSKVRPTPRRSTRDPTRRPPSQG